MTNINTEPNTATLEGPVIELRDRVVRLIYDVAEHIGTMGDEGAADKKRLLENAADLREMFLMVVVIGEFNAGKSSFVNALIGEPVLPMGITPTTDMIELIRYSPTPVSKPNATGESVREWGHPSVGLPGVVIVDTPGTGSVFAKHEQIAKSFLHRSDLVIFVLSAKRAFAETERLYLDLARSYGKKIIIVVNQVDLLDEREREEVRSFVRKQVDELLNIRPQIFMVSAKKALQGGHRGGLLGRLTEDANLHGIDEVRAYLRETFEAVPPAKQKLLTQIELLRSVLAKYRASIGGKLSLIGNDTTAAEDLQREIERQAGSLDEQLANTLKEIHAVFEGVRRRGRDFIDRHMNVLRAARKGLDQKAMRAEFENVVLGDALKRIMDTQEHYAGAMVDSGRAYWRSVLDRLSRMEALLRQEQTSMDATAYADQRAALQAAMTMADIELKGYTENRVLEELEADFSSNVRTFIYGLTSTIGGLIAVIVSIITPGTLAAHPLAALGFGVGAIAVAIGGGIAYTMLRRAAEDANKKLDAQVSDLENRYRESLSSITSKERARLIQYGKQILAPVFGQLQSLAQRYKGQQAQLTTFDERIAVVSGELDTLTLERQAGSDAQVKLSKQRLQGQTEDEQGQVDSVEIQKKSMSK